MQTLFLIADLMHRDDVGVALGDDDAAGLRRGRTREIGREELAALVKEVDAGRRLWAVDVLRPAPFVVRNEAAPGKAAHASARVGQRKDDLRAKAVVDAPALVGLHREAGVVELAVAESRSARRVEHRVPCARRVADAKLAQRSLLEAALCQVRSRTLGLLRFPQLARVVRGGALEQLEQTLAAHTLLGRARILVLELEGDLVTVGEQLERALEVHALGLHDEREGVARGLAAEAVVDLLGRVDPERRRALVVKRAQPGEAVGARLAQLGARRDEIDHVDRLADALLGVVGVEGHRAGSPTA